MPVGSLGINHNGHPCRYGILASTRKADLPTSQSLKGLVSIALWLAQSAEMASNEGWEGSWQFDLLEWPQVGGADQRGSVSGAGVLLL